ncbi:hypothetical protein AB0H82_07480 [Streptomyces sp. NPDC050732]|uniref:hypothetical protein n=1 Tax=Streptomyces sp. NPDC050732 TaxID=3154632 RepID=UPI00343ACC79
MKLISAVPKAKKLTAIRTAAALTMRPADDEHFVVEHGPHALSCGRWPAPSA